MRITPGLRQYPRLRRLARVEVLDDALVQIHLLGGFVVSIAGRPVGDDAWRLRRARTLIKLLVLAPDHRMHREQLMERLWPEGPPAGNSLHQVLYTARRALGTAPVRLAMRDSVVTLDGDALWVDVDAFETQAGAARSSRTADAYRAALALYGGELLPEDRYEDWSHARRDALRETQLALLVELAALQAESGERVAAVETLQRAIVEDPLHEAAHRELMRLFAVDGRGQQALAQYQQLRDVLGRELGADPDPQTRELYRAILAGQHHAEAAGGSPSHLPRQLTGFVGRARELAELERLLARSRLLTLTGPGGSGKTRLALELAARREPRFDQGARLVELAPIRDPALAVGETARALGVQLRSGDDPVAALVAQVQDASLLLVLDNCEHLIDACAALADALLRSCPNVCVLATSRERLRIPGEAAWRVPSLSLPASGAATRAADLEHSEAVRLFCERAAETSRTFALSDDNAEAVAEICRRLDGMPLALELAAARADLLSPAQIAQRLGDALALLRAGSRTGLTRQQSLRATLEWSHDLLTAPEQVLYRRLGVFAGTFGVDAVEGICGADDTLDLLARLTDKSLVQVEASSDGHRYRLLDTIRQHAGERLAAAGERERSEAAHRDWYLALAEAADRDLDPAVAATWPADRLEAEHDDLRTALASAIRHEPPAALRLAVALWWFWMARGYFVEGSRRLEEALAAAPAPTADRARALLRLAGLTVRLRYGNTERIAAYGEEALAITRAAGDRRAIARALERHGMLAMGSFDFAAAERAFAEGLALALEIGDRPVTIAIKHAQGVLAACRGDNAAARALLGEALGLLDDVEDERPPLFWALHISPVVIPAGPGGVPRAFFEDTFVLMRAVARRAGIGYVLCNVAEVWRSDGKYGPAREALERALALFRELGDDQGAGVVLNALGNLARSTGDYDAGRAWFADALALRRAARDRREIATTLCGMGLLALYAGDASGRDQVEEASRIFDRIEDGPGRQLIPMNLAGYELDAGNPRRACRLLDRVAMVEEHELVRSRGWAEAELAEAAIALGSTERARRAADAALASFRALGEERGVQRVRALAEQLVGPDERRVSGRP
jgi:predicted ATPase/DNA-binding SARP family transcriptional activator